MNIEAIDTNWFRGRLADRRLSQRQLAKHMGLDPAAVSLMLRGKRKASANEVAEIANLLGVSADDVVLHLGSTPTVPARATPREAQDVPIMRISGTRADHYGQGSMEIATRVHSLKAMDVSTGTPELGRPTMVELPVPMSDGSTAKLLLPRVLGKVDADRIAALVQAIAMP